MEFVSSKTQRKTLEKIQRLRAYFRGDRPEVFAWDTSDEVVDFASMSDDDVARYLERKK